MVKQKFELLKQEVISHKITYVLLLFIFFGGLFLRTYRTFDLLRFYYDQGRDAIAIYKILGGHLTLLGPTTGFFGIFRGPFFYYYLLPGYIIGQGNPAIAAVYIATINAFGIILIYIAGASFFTRTAGIIAATLVAFSYYAILSARWLSNPSPLWFFSPLCFLLIVYGVQKSWKFLAVGLFVLGLCLQLEEAGMGFVTIAIILFLFLHIKKIPVVGWLISLAAFFITFLPLLLFDIRNHFLITHNVLKLLFGSGNDKSFAATGNLVDKLTTFSGEFGKELFVNGSLHSFMGLNGIVLGIIIIGFVSGSYRYWKNRAWQLAIIWLVVPIVFLSFYQKAFFEYYITGLYPIFLLVVGIAITQFTKFRLGFIVMAFAITAFLYINRIYLFGYLTSHVETNAPTISLENQIQAMHYIYTSSEDKTLAIAVYVPPQQTDAYDYLFRWYRKTYFPKVAETPLSQAVYFYTLEEIDPDHSDLRLKWIDAQNLKGSLIETKRFGGISVDKRSAIKQ